MTTKIPTDMMASDMATQAELNTEKARLAVLEDSTTGKLAGDVVQVVNTQTGAMTSNNTVIPADDTIPQNTEGFEVMTLAITPKSASNKLKIDVVAVVSHASDAGTVTLALLQDSTANALAATLQSQSAANGTMTLHLTHYMTAGTTSATTFKVNIGPNTSATVTFNGSSGGRWMGGVMASSITITEIKA